MTTTDVDAEAVMVALVVAPGVYSRNRMFSLFEKSAMKHARLRATLLRGILRQWMGYKREDVRISFPEAQAGQVRLQYSIESIRLRCEVALTELEAVCLRYVASRGPTPVLAAHEDDAKTVQQVLGRLGPQSAPS